HTCGIQIKIVLSKPQFILVYISLILSIFMAALDQTIVSTALKAIVVDLRHQQLIPWIGSAYLMTAAPVGTLYGKFADIFGRKWVFVFAIVVFELGSLLCGVATSMEFLIVGRAVAGIGGGGIFALVNIIITDIVSMRDRAKYQAAVGAFFGLAAVIAPLVGGSFADHVSWRWCFYINLPLGAITLVNIILFLNFPPEFGSMKKKFGRVDIIGATLLFAAIICLITPLQLGGSIWAWNSAQVIATFVASVVLFVVFAYVELKVAKEPIVPPAIFINSSVPAFLVINVAMGAAFLAGVYYISLFFQVVFNDSATDAGLHIIPFVCGIVLLSLFTGFFVSKFGHYKIFFLVGPFIVAAGTILISMFDGSSTKAEQILYLAIFGIGLGNMIQLRVIGLQASVPLELIAIATAVGQTCNSLGSAIGVAISGTIFNNVVTSNTANDVELQYFISKFQAMNITIQSSDVLSLLGLLQASASNYPSDPVAAAQYNATLATATFELVIGFNDAFKIAYLTLLPYPGIVLLMALFFVKQFSINKSIAHSAAE
ncbi:hypothetical protein HK100_007261, partial [Physocladia obscura]